MIFLQASPLSQILLKDQAESPLAVIPMRSNICNKRVKRVHVCPAIELNPNTAALLLQT